MSAKDEASRLAGPRKHLHMYCDGDCGTQLME